MGEGTVFSLSVHTSTGGGGLPHLADGGGVTHLRSGWRVPYLRSRWGGTTSQVQMGGIRIRMGVPCGTPDPGLDRVPPLSGHRSA